MLQRLNVCLYETENAVKKTPIESKSVYFHYFSTYRHLLEFLTQNQNCYIVTTDEKEKKLKKKLSNYDRYLKIIITKRKKDLIKKISKNPTDKYMLGPVTYATLDRYLAKIYTSDFTYTPTNEEKNLMSQIATQKKELESSTALLQSYKKAVDAGTILSKTDTKGIITYVNEEFCSISGYSKDELIGHPHNIIRHPDSDASMFKKMWETIQNKQIWQGEVKNLKKDGTHYWVDATIVPILDENDTIVEYAALRHNITEVMDYKESLEEKVTAKTKEITKNIKLLEEYKNAVDASSIMSKTDVSGRITYINEEFCKVAQYKEHELLGKPHNIVRHPDMPKEAFKDMWDTILDKKIWKGVVKNRAKDGSAYWVQATIVPILDDRNRIVEFVGLRQDITELMSYRQELEQRVSAEVEKNRVKDMLLQQQSAQAAIGEMVNSIAHQWRQPINSISLEATNILLDTEGQTDSDEVVESAQNITYLTKTMSQTISDFMEFSNPHREIQNFSLKGCVASIEKMLESQLFGKNIRFYNECDPGLMLYTYKNDLKQVIINLVNNAKDAFENDNTDHVIRVVSEQVGEEVFIHVKDNAGGIAEAIQEEVFKPYFTTKDKSKGTGLGLYISKKIIQEQLQGEMELNSSSGDTCFTVKIPVETQQDNSTKETDA